MIIPTCRVMSQSQDGANQSIHRKTDENLRQGDIRFFIEVHLFAGKLVLVVVIHSLGGSHANWHHTRNP
jgi:hypothetical protein